MTNDTRTADRYGIFDNQDINSEYLRWLDMLGDQVSAGEDMLSVEEVLRAHFLVANFFADDNNGLGTIGPRNGGRLLLSTMARQTVGYDGRSKWNGPFEIAATMLFGLVKNHPFHDGNKRTALLSVLHLLEKRGWTAKARKEQLENLVAGVASNRYRANDLYIYLHEQQGQPADDAAVLFVAARLKKMVRRRERTRHSITFRKLRQLLGRHGFVMRDSKDNKITVARSDDGQAIWHIGYPGDSKQVPVGELARLRKACGLAEADGVDSAVFFRGMDSMDFLLQGYAEPLQRLADR